MYVHIKVKILIWVQIQVWIQIPVQVQTLVQAPVQISTHIWVQIPEASGNRAGPNGGPVFRRQATVTVGEGCAGWAAAADGSDDIPHLPEGIRVAELRYGWNREQGRPPLLLDTTCLIMG